MSHLGKSNKLLVRENMKEEEKEAKGHPPMQSTRPCRVPVLFCCTFCVDNYKLLFVVRRLLCESEEKGGPTIKIDIESAFSQSIVYLSAV